MKKIIILSALIFSIIQVFGQKNTNNSAKIKGYPPKGYPCLGCQPCPGNPSEFCDIQNNNTTLQPHPEALKLGYVYYENKMVPLKAFVEKPEIKRKLKEVGEITIFDETEGATNKTKVKCGCGSHVYAKDAAACIRICDFLGDTSGNY